MHGKTLLLFFAIVSVFNFHCTNKSSPKHEPATAEILGNPDYPAICFGGFRHGSRDTVPSVAELKEDLAILAAMQVKIIRTYNTQQYGDAVNLLKAISEMKAEHPDFEMYVMLGAWIDCENAWTASPNHDAEDSILNAAEIDAAVAMANQYPDIVKIIAVGNEAMVKWATGYFVAPKVILKWVTHLQQLKQAGKIPAGIWITSSDNFASWGGGDDSYHTDDLTALMRAVDYISMHTYPFHDTYYNPSFWEVPAEEKNLTDSAQVEAAMLRTRDYAIAQYRATVAYMKSLGIEKPVHIGETGWASMAATSYGPSGTHAADEYK